jgi:hypothetical protein
MKNKELKDCSTEVLATEGAEDSEAQRWYRFAILLDQNCCRSLEASFFGLQQFRPGDFVTLRSFEFVKLGTYGEGRTLGD